MAARRRFHTLDVFTDTALAGNPLAVVLDAEGLETRTMRALAREFNLSETVFVLPPEHPRHRARLRIFTPTSELPFAGHPTVGTSVLLALRDRGGRPRSARADAVAFGLEEGIGVVPCVVEAGDGGDGAQTGYARLRVPSLPSYRGEGLGPDGLAPLVGLAPDALGFGRHAPSRHAASRDAAGPAFTFVPVATPQNLDAAQLDASAFERARRADRVDALCLYTPDPAAAGLGYQVRMFAPHLGVPEDPATGSAAAAFAGVLMQFERLGAGTHDVAIRQGLAMGRPSAIALQVTVEAGTLRAVEIGGAAVVVSEGHLFV